MQAHTITGPTGKVTTFIQQPSGTCYHESTSDEVIRVLEGVMRSKRRIRLFYGDTATGRSWLDEWDVIGHLGRSMGPIKIPLLLKSLRSSGGSGILDHCIIRIQEGHQVLYSHPDFHIGATSIRRGDMKKLPWELWIDDQLHARFEQRSSAEILVEFLLGNRNDK